MNVAITNLIKPFLPMAVKELDKIDGYIGCKLQGVELQPDEVCAAYLIIQDRAGTVHLLLCTFDGDDKMVRQIERQTMNDFLHAIFKEIM